jgi:uncharacterized protein (DUF2147 family)
MHGLSGFATRPKVNLALSGENTSSYMQNRENETMKTFMMVLVATVSLSAGAAHAADPVHGMWQTLKDDNGNYGHIEVTECGNSICGTLAKSFDNSGKSITTANAGRKIIWNMKADGGGAYSGGKVYSPDRDKTYNSKMTLKGNSLNIKGCVLGICRDGGTWKRVN